MRESYSGKQGGGGKQGKRETRVESFSVVCYCCSRGCLWATDFLSLVYFSTKLNYCCSRGTIDGQQTTFLAMNILSLSALGPEDDQTGQQPMVYMAHPSKTLSSKTPPSYAGTRARRGFLIVNKTSLSTSPQTNIEAPWGRRHRWILGWGIWYTTRRR